MSRSVDQLTWTTLVGVDSHYTQTVFTDIGLTTGDQYYYKYSVRNAAGWSMPSDSILITVGTEPA